MFSRLRPFALALVILLPGLCSEAFAQIRADFDGDGVLDTATIVAERRSHINVALSGSERPVRLPVAEHLASLVAIDVDRDGLADLAGSNKGHEIVVWHNEGGRHFLQWRKPRAHRPRAGIPLVSPHRRADDPATGRDEEAPASTDGGYRHPALVPERTGGSPLFAATGALFGPVAETLLTPAKSLGSRAPPASLF